MLNKMRTFLTMLGIIIGVASVIAMLAIGEGSKESIKTQISSMGSNMITIKPGSDVRGGVRLERRAMETLTLNDYEAIKKETTLLTSFSPLVNSGGQSIYGANNWPTSVYGVAPDYLKIKIWDVAEGSNFTEKEVSSAAKVAVIGQTVAENLFKDGAPARRLPCRSVLAVPLLFRACCATPLPLGACRPAPARRQSCPFPRRLFAPFVPAARSHRPRLCRSL